LIDRWSTAQAGGRLLSLLRSIDGQEADETSILSSVISHGARAFTGPGPGQQQQQDPAAHVLVVVNRVAAARGPVLGRGGPQQEAGE